MTSPIRAELEQRIAARLSRHLALDDDCVRVAEFVADLFTEVDEWWDSIDTSTYTNRSSIEQRSILCRMVVQAIPIERPIDRTVPEDNRVNRPKEKP